MGSVAEAVLQFDEAVQVPWRPPLAAVGGPAERSSGALVFAPPSTRRPRAARAARLTVPPPLPEPSAPARPTPAGSTVAAHACTRCAGDARAVARVRFTRRARRLLAVVVAAVALVLGTWVGNALDGEDDDLVLVSNTRVVVEPGDTLWSIARAVPGDQDVRAVVDAIWKLNDLRDPTLQPGQVLRLP